MYVRFVLTLIFDSFIETKQRLFSQFLV